MANHVLMISNDAALALQPSGDARTRHLGYAERIGHLSIIVPTPPGVDTPIVASPHLTIHASNSPLKARYPIDSVRRAIAIDRAQRVELIVTHDPS